MRKTSFRLVAFTVVVMMALVACGQKPGVHLGGNAGFGVNDLSGTSGTGPGGTGPGVTGPGGTGPGGTGPGVTGPGVTGPGGTGPGGTGPGAAGTAGGNRTGITDDEIVIGLHAPLTGAAPVEPKAFAVGKDLYWKWLESKGKDVFGRKVRVVFRNDEYTPTTAVSVCNTMATSEKAFLLIGGAGTDQINACAGYAEPRGIPYLSPGVQEAGLKARRNYFPVTMTYAQQMPLLVQLLKKKNAGNALDKFGAPTGGGDGTLRIGHVRPNTPNFNDAAAALKNAATAAGFEFKQFTVVKEGNQSEAKTVATQLRQNGIDVVVPITAPLFTIQLAINTGADAYLPMYAGVGITNNINQVMDRVCDRSQFQGALFFSPWPGWRNVMNKEFDKDFAEAADRFAGSVNARERGGDILLALWGIMKVLHQMLLAAGPNVTRESFIATLSNFKLETKVFPDLAYSPSSHFGAKNVHLLIGDCGSKEFFSHDPPYYGLRSSF